jgi:O-methyltransferase involved in polyketide biosynthesis
VTGTRSSFGAADKVEAPQATPAERRTIEPALFDPSRPNIARVYDYWLGGKDNYAADRAEAERLIAVYPRLPLLARQSRLFLARAVQWLAKQGITQFLDLGCGLPTGQNTHEIAQAVHPDCRVVYVDADPVVVSHAQALLRGPGVTAIHGDLAEPSEILAELHVRHQINLAEPTAVILAMVLHFFDAATANDIVATFARAVTPGSYIVLSVGSGDEQTGGALAREYRAGTLHNHSLAQIAAFVEDLELIPPGVTDAMAWMPGSPSQPPPPQSGGHILAGVARKPGAGTRAFPRL